MSDKHEHTRKALADVFESVTDLEYFADTEIVGEDARHLINAVDNAKRECARVMGECASGNLNEMAMLKYLYDRLKQVKSSVKVMQGTLSRCERAIEKAITDCDRAADIIEPENYDFNE